jgi:hypothetical protein
VVRPSKMHAALPVGEEWEKIKDEESTRGKPAIVEEVRKVAFFGQHRTFALPHAVLHTKIKRSAERGFVFRIINIPDNHKGNPAESVSLRARCKVQVHRAVLPAFWFCAAVSGPRFKNVCFGIRSLDRGSSSDQATLTTALLCSDRRACLSSAPFAAAPVLYKNDHPTGSGPKGWRHACG